MGKYLTTIAGFLGQYDDLATRELQNTEPEERDEYSISRVVISTNWPAIIAFYTIH